MNKLVVFAATGVVLVGAGVAIFATHGGEDTKKTATSASAGEVKTGSEALVNVDACDILTEPIAKQILGEAAVKGDTQEANASSEAVSVSNCVYFVKGTGGTPVENAKNVKGVSVLARSAKTKAGADGNKAIFKTLPAGAENVDGIGDKAFFKASSYGQMSVLKGGNYYIISNYTGNPPTATLEADKALAALLEFK